MSSPPQEKGAPPFLSAKQALLSAPERQRQYVASDPVTAYLHRTPAIHEPQKPPRQKRTVVPVGAPILGRREQTGNPVK